MPEVLQREKVKWKQGRSPGCLRRPSWLSRHTPKSRVVCHGSDQRVILRTVYVRCSVLMEGPSMSQSGNSRVKMTRSPDWLLRSRRPRRSRLQQLIFLPPLTLSLIEECKQVSVQRARRQRWILLPRFGQAVIWARRVRRAARLRQGKRMLKWMQNRWSRARTSREEP